MPECCTVVTLQVFSDQAIGLTGTETFKSTIWRSVAVLNRRVTVADAFLCQRPFLWRTTVCILPS